MSGHKTLQQFAEGATIPVINAADDFEHPCQTVADIMTIMEKKGKDLSNVKISFIWTLTPRPKIIGLVNSWLNLSSILGINMTIAHPKGFEMDPTVAKWADEQSEVSGATITYTNDLEEAARDADIIYCKSWQSVRMEYEEDIAYRKKHNDELKKWTITPELMQLAKKTANFMHALPADREIEVSNSIMDGPQSIIWDQAENRLHGQKAILALTMR
jgi:ornithine carbamoyltransferase